MGFIKDYNKEIQLLKNLGFFNGTLDRKKRFELIESKKLSRLEYGHVEYWYRTYLRFKDVFENTGSWIEVYKLTHYDALEDAVAFIELAEEVAGKDILSVKQLQDVTQIDSLPDYDPDTKKWSFKGNKEISKKEVIENLSQLFYDCKLSLYSTKLENILSNGGKYKDLLEVDPVKEFGLVEPYEYTSFLGRSNRHIIARAINNVFDIDEVGGLMVYPSLRKLAKLIEAPYSVLMEAFKSTVR